jgi:hypothetical protein
VYWESLPSGGTNIFDLNYLVSVSSATNFLLDQMLRVSLAERTLTAEQLANPMFQTLSGSAMAMDVTSQGGNMLLRKWWR